MARAINNFVPGQDHFLSEKTLRNWLSGKSRSIEEWDKLIAVAYVLHMGVRDVEQMLNISELPALEQLYPVAEEPFREYIEILLWKKDRFNLSKQTRILTILDSLISNLTIASQESYEWHKFAEGINMYIDRPQARQTFRYIPHELRDERILITANNDKRSSAKDLDFIAFTVNQNAKVYIVYTTKNTLLERSWLNEENGWFNENFEVVTTLLNDENGRKISSKLFQADTRVELGGNGGTGEETSMYHVVVVPVAEN